MSTLNDKKRSVKQFSENLGQSVGQFATKAADVSTKKLHEVGQTVREKTVDITVKARLIADIVNDKTKQQFSEVVNETLEKA